MSQLIEIKTTFGNNAEAIKIINKITKILLQDKLASCIQSCKINSFYCWPEGSNNIQNDEEILLTIKTQRQKYHQIEQIILKNHQYELPQIIFSKISGGYQPFMNWLSQN